MSTPEDTQRRLIGRAAVRARLTSDDLWVRYFGLGGTVGPVELDAFLAGLMPLGAVERDLAAQAVNERLDEMHDLERAPYSRDVRQAHPRAGPLAALVELLRGAHLSPPDLLPEIIDRAAEALAVRAVLYLADYTVTSLVPFPGAHGHDRHPLDIDGTVPGRAFRQLDTRPSQQDGVARLWIPVLDGVERLGVLDVMVDDPREVDDPALREQCWWLAHSVGHLVTLMGDYGDAVDRVRRRAPRSVAAELVWQMLPPLTAGTDAVVVSGRTEPCEAVGGDVFDYALSDENVHLAIFDATGHDLGAGLVAATALAAYRNARRQGASLFSQAEAVDAAVADQFGGETFATGVLARLDPRTGVLRYVAAGHPHPLVLRDGKVVLTLEDGRRTMFGLEARDMSVGEVQLQPEDMVVLYTDGITEARDDHGVTFGLDGLSGFLERAAASQMPLPEVVRRLTKAILRRQGGALRDDATLLLAHWSTEAQALLAPPPLRLPGR